MVVLDFHEHAGDVIGSGQLDPVAGVCLGRDELVWVDHLRRIAAVVHCGKLICSVFSLPAKGRRVARGHTQLENNRAASPLEDPT